jgi:hypothetical protein
MLKRKHNNEKIEAIGKKLVENDLLPISEIDRIVANPHLFDLVSKRIAANERSAVPRSYRWLPAATASLAGVVVLAFFGSAIIRYLGEADGAPSMTFIQVPDAGPEVARPEIPPKGMFGKLSQGRAPIPAASREQAVRKPRKPIRSSPKPTTSAVDRMDEFYAISVLGVGDAGGERVIRVDMSRSSLFALGINVPLENGPDTVKTDLLIGADGTPRGIRLVE